jgi:hypothetical protein
MVKRRNEARDSGSGMICHQQVRWNGSDMGPLMGLAVLGLVNRLLRL